MQVDRALHRDNVSDRCTGTTSEARTGTATQSMGKWVNSTFHALGYIEIVGDPHSYLYHTNVLRTTWYLLNTQNARLRIEFLFRGC